MLRRRQAMKSKRTNKNAVPAKSEGVPRETPERNCFRQLTAVLTPAIGAAAARRLVAKAKKRGYFELGLLDQANLLIGLLVDLGQAEMIAEALLNSTSDKIRSLGVGVHFEHFKDDIERELESLKRTGAFPGTWTQETSQTVLKNMVHHHGLAKILPRVQRWVEDLDPAVRRMVAEALRPRGVWCKQIAELKADPTPIKRLLERLLDDPSEYVRKAVANSLNDISKDNPEMLCRWAAEWSKGRIGKERQWIVQRGLRTLVRENHPTAMKLLGLDHQHQSEVTWKRGTPREIAINSAIPFELAVDNGSDREVKLRLQLVMIGPGRNNKPRIAKYLLGTVTVKAFETKGVLKSVRFTHRNSVPKLPGTYRLQVLANGKLIGERATHYAGDDLKSPTK